jgi:flavodoxin I
LKILVCYFSNTGNTEKVAKSIAEGLMSEDVDVLKIEEAEPLNLRNYDLVVLGSGIYGGKLNKKVIDFMKGVNEYPPEFAFFNTHQSATSYQNAFKRIRTKLEENNSEVIGEFDCVGENLGMPKETILGMLEKLPPDEKKRQEAILEKTVGHPDAQDLENAKIFGKSLIK